MEERDCRVTLDAGVITAPSFSALVMSTPLFKSFMLTALCFLCCDSSIGSDRFFSSFDLGLDFRVVSDDEECIVVVAGSEADMAWSWFLRSSLINPKRVLPASSSSFVRPFDCLESLLDILYIVPGSVLLCVGVE